MVHKHHVEGYDKFCEFIKDFDGKKQEVYVYFSGSKLPSGESWCDDCIRSTPIIEKALAKKGAPDAHFIYCEVGDRPTWKNPKCPFRTDKRTNLLVLPTLVKWQNPQKLSGDQCEKLELVEMLFSDDD